MNVHLGRFAINFWFRITKCSHGAHQWSEWNYLSDTSCEQQRSCCRCPSVENRFAAHQWGNAKYLLNNSKWIRRLTCNRCDAIVDSDIMRYAVAKKLSVWLASESNETKYRVLTGLVDSGSLAALLVVAEVISSSVGKDLVMKEIGGTTESASQLATCNRITRVQKEMLFEPLLQVIPDAEASVALQLFAKLVNANVNFYHLEGNDVINLYSQARNASISKQEYNIRINRTSERVTHTETTLWRCYSCASGDIGGGCSDPDCGKMVEYEVDGGTVEKYNVYATIV